MVEQKRFALFLAMPDSEFAIKTYGGYFNVFKSLLGDEGEEWDLFRVYENEFPEEKDYEKYDGFVISGSPSDSFLDLDWILKLCDVVRKLDEMKKKMLGICFGHQVIARALGGKSGRARNGHMLCLGNITINKEAVSPENYFGDEIPANLRIVKAHQDEVLELPENAKIFAYSEKYEVEMYSIQNHILCVQGHPEYNREIMFEILDRVHSQGHIPKEYVDASKATMEKNDADRNVWQKVFKKFLKG